MLIRNIITKSDTVRRYPSGLVTYTSNNDLVDVFDQVSVPGDKITPTPYTYNKTIQHAPKGSYVSPYVSISGNLTGLTCDHSWSHSGLGGGETFAALDDRAYRSAYNKMIDLSRNRSDDTGHDLFVSIYESPELKDLYAQLKDMMKQIRERKFLRALKKVHPSVAMAEYYLLWTFGISPLIQAMNEILDTLDKGVISNDNIKATGKAESNSEGTVSAGTYTEHDFLDYKSSRVSISFERTLTDPMAALRAQFGLNTVASSYYATVPLSFVIDWFVNIGSYLNALEHVHSNTGYAYRNGFKTTTHVHRYMKTMTRPLPDGTKVSGQSFYRGSYSQRIKLPNNLPNPPLPTFKPSLNGGKILSMAALLRGFTK